MLATVVVKLVSPDHREVRNKTFIREWQQRIQRPPGIDRISITEQQSGPPGKDVDIRLTGSDPQQLKDAADALSVLLSGIEGVVSTEDDMSWGREQLVYSLTPYGQALGLSIESVGTQLRAAYDGRLAQIYQDKRDEIEVRVQLPRAERESLASLSDLSIRLDDGRFVPLRQVITFTSINKAIKVNLEPNLLAIIFWL